MDLPAMFSRHRIAAALILATLALAGAGHAAPASADPAPPMAAPDADEATAPKPTAPGQVALFYYKLAGQQPDFTLWARESDAYLKANAFDKELVAREKASEASRAYQLVTFDDPIVVAVPIKLSTYSRAQQGFFVENFRPDTFYSYHFIDRDYALVPIDLMDYKWLSVESPAQMKRIADTIAISQNTAMLYMQITPNFADKDKPMHIGDKDYWLMSGKIKRLQVYDSHGKKLLWESYGKGEMDTNQKELLDLYK